MNNTELTIEPLLREFLQEDKLIFELEKALTKPVSNKVKLDRKSVV